MKAVGIIAEYNPFHNGHLYQINKAKELSGADGVVCIMSGNFVQRGQIAICDKWTRAEMALSSGVDLVIELPCYYSLGSAEVFANGGVSSLNALGLIDELWFGSECGDIEKLNEAAIALSNETEQISIDIKKYLDKGMSYPSARTKAYSKSLGLDEEIMSAPNNILAIEYIKAINKLNRRISPKTITRYKTEYHSTTPSDSFASATAIRKLISDGKDFSTYIPIEAYKTWQKAVQNRVAPVFESALDNVVLYKLRSMPLRELANINDVTEGLEYRIKEAAVKSTSACELINIVKTKRYTTSRISRIIWSAVIGIKESPFIKKPEYIRVLGLNKTGAKILAKAKKNATLPIITKMADFDISSSELIAYDIAATDLFVIGYPDTNKRAGAADFTTSPVVVD